MESLTADLIAKAKEYIREIDEAGGMIQAVEAGVPKLRIEQAATEKQARLDNSEDVGWG